MKDDLLLVSCPLGTLDIGVTLSLLDDDPSIYFVVYSNLYNK